MDELSQHINAIASASEHDSRLPPAVGALTAVVAARTLLEMAEDAPLVRDSPAVQRDVATAVDACDRAAVGLA